MKRVLIICYYWPPAGGPGVQRWLKFVKYFKQFGVEPVVFVPENAHYPLEDDSFVSEVPKDVTVISLPIKEPYRFAKWFSKKKTKTISSGIISEKDPATLEKLMLFVRGNLFIPDARIGWVKPSVRYLKKYLKDAAIDTVVTTGPPHSLHLIGMRLKETLGMKWVADFRDPWTTIHYHKSLRLTAFSEKKHKALEHRVLNTADHVVVTSPNTKNEFAEITKKPITVITNGFDTSEVITQNLDTTFSLVHVGSLLSNRNPNILWQVISELREELQGFKDTFRLKLVGAVGEDILESIEEYGLTDATETPGYVSHHDALMLQHNAQVLLLVEMDREETRAIIPGKLFEYLRAKRPILAFGPKGSDMAKIIKETRSGAFFEYSEKQELKQEIVQLFDAFLHSNLTGSDSNLNKYSRRELTKTMATLLKAL
ncbi:MAG: glycosyltransferase family 4 protein [Bacteroidetes bacterium]|nr:glycosyltransferase family 4 protein [Bacteroidota bacterium]